MTSHPPVVNIANALTVLRILLVPVFLHALLAEDGLAWRLLACAVFAVAAITDQIDGHLARTRGLVTDFGRIADPIADKTLVGAALISLSILGELAWWVTIVIAVRELAVTALRFAVIRHRVIPASRGGKLKTLAQLTAIMVLLVPLPVLLPMISLDGLVPAVDPVRRGIVLIAVVLTVLTGADYFRQALRAR